MDKVRSETSPGAQYSISRFLDDDGTSDTAIGIAGFVSSKPMDARDVSAAHGVSNAK